mmetsp:Transcript_12702/g.50996  ORF Transcript_12702/g.50996 Transcript_12702/m.50996 type:complete len:390 (-) Transcript_12702:375-1544(-)
MSNGHVPYFTRLTNFGRRHALTATVRAIPRPSLRARSTVSRHKIAVVSFGAGGATGASPAQTLSEAVSERFPSVARMVSAAATGEANATSGAWDGEDVETGHKKKLRVAYQGMPGAYSEAAALAAYPTCDPCPCEQFENAFEATEQWTADRAVLPFENSLGGSIHRNYDLILQHRLHIVGEVFFKVRHCLLALPGQSKEDIKRAQSHPQALSQCDGYLTTLGVVKEAVDDTAGAAAAISAGGQMGVAAVASRRAAELYGMEVLEEDIQDDKSNVTRFLALAREPILPRPGIPYKTSIAFSMKEESGSLFKALACFALRDINLTKVESRPMRWNPVTQQVNKTMQFSYLFYVDFEASMADENAQNALRQLQEKATFLRVLGSYPADDSRL